MKKTFKNIFGFKAFSVLLSLSLLFGALWCVPAFAEDEGTTVNVWDGTAATKFDGGDGTEAKPYKISNGGQLYNMAKSEGKDSSGKALYYEITSDIYLNDVNSGSYTNDWVKNVYSNDNYRFIGTVDGNCHTVYGLYANNKWKSRIALFPYLGANAAVKNIRLSNAKLTTTFDGKVYIGGIAAQVMGANVTVSGCSLESSEITALAANSVIGGIIASAEGNAPVVNNCAFIGTLNRANTSVTSGGIIGLAWTENAKVSNCYSIGAFPVFANNATNIRSYTCTNVYTNISAEDSNIETDITEYTTSASLKTQVDGYAKVLSEDEMTGVSAKANMSKFNFYTAWQAVENGYPVPRTTDCANYGGGDGKTKQTAFEISTDAQLYKLATDNDTAGKYYKLTADITLNDNFAAAAQWVTAGDYTTTVFRGNLDGNGKTVRGLYVKTSDNATKIAGLFPVIGAGAVISNLKVNGAYLYGGNSNTSDYFFGAIAGAVNLSLSDEDTASDPMKWPTIVACGVENADVNARYAGGIIGGGAGKARIESSYSANLNLLNDAYTGNGGKTAGGIIGKSWNPSSFFVKNCYTTYSSSFAGDASVVQSNVISGVKVATNGNTSVPSGLFFGTFKEVENSVPVPSTAVKFIKVDTVKNTDSLTAIRNYLLGDRNIYIVDVNNDVTFDICDLVYAALGE